MSVATRALLAALLALYWQLGVAADMRGRERVNQIFAGCEARAYNLLGVQLNSSASMEYLEKKYEVIRVCMVQHGFKTNLEDFYAGAAEVAAQARAAGDWSEAELKRRLLIRKISPRFWN